MAMMTCKECKNAISTKADTCPNCGAKVPKGLTLGKLLALGCGSFGLLFVLLMFYTCSSAFRDRFNMGDSPASESGQDQSTREERLKWTIEHGSPEEAALAREMLQLMLVPEVGMTAEVLRRRVGPPDKVNRTVFANYTHEQWVYNPNDSKRWSGYVYLDDGVVRSYQESK